MYGVRCTLGYAGCGGYANVEAYSTQQRIKSILFYSTNDDNDKATEWVENGGEQWRGMERGREGGARQTTKIFVVPFVWAGLFMASNEFCRNNKLIRRTFSHGDRTPPEEIVSCALGAHMFIICFRTQKEQQQHQHRHQPPCGTSHANLANWNK